jgi:hypothetical protein
MDCHTLFLGVGKRLKNYPKLSKYNPERKLPLCTSFEVWKPPKKAEQWQFVWIYVYFVTGGMTYTWHTTLVTTTLAKSSWCDIGLWSYFRSHNGSFKLTGLLKASTFALGIIFGNIVSPEQPSTNLWMVIGMVMFLLSRHLMGYINCNNDV